MTLSTIALTGATGFIGKHLLNDLLAAGHSVLALHRRSSEKGLPQHEQLHWFQLQEARAAFKARSPRALLHLATNYGSKQFLSEVVESNVVMPLQLLEAALEVDCTLLVNTDSYFSKPEFDYPHMQAYIESKRIFLKCCNHIITERPLMRVVNARLEHVYGPGDGSEKFVSRVLAHLVADKELELSPGDQVRDFIHVRDVSAAYLAIVTAAKGFAPGIKEMQIGTGRAVSIRDFVTAAKAVAGSSSRLRFGALPYRPGEIMGSAASATSLTALAGLGWAPCRSLDEGLQDTLEALRTAMAEKPIVQ